MDDSDSFLGIVEIDLEQLLHLRDIDDTILSVGGVSQIENRIWINLIGPVWLRSEQGRWAITSFIGIGDTDAEANHIFICNESVSNFSSLQGLKPFFDTDSMGKTRTKTYFLWPLC